MPKAAPGPSLSSSRAALRRNQACRACRKRKLKCDAARPHCGTCTRQWQATISVPAPVGYAHPAEPQCLYDPVDGLTPAPDIDPYERIRELEEQIAHLRQQLPEQSDPGFTNPSASEKTSPLSSDSPEYNGCTAPASGGTLLSGNAYEAGPSTLSTNTPMTAAPSSASPQEDDSHAVSPRSGNVIAAAKQDSPGADPFMELLFSGWNPDLPDRNTLNHYVDVYFKCDPCSHQVLHRPSFLASLLLPPRDPGFPHSALLHAICASASRWTPQGLTTLSDGSRRDSFAEYHASKTRQYIDKTMASGEDIFAVMQACIILSWYFYQEGRWVEVWIFAAFQTRVAVPLRLNYPGTFCTHGNNSPGAYLAPPKGFRDLESRRRTWWMTILFDRIVSVGGWLHAIDERDLGTEFPLRSYDFDAENVVPSNPQDLTTPDVFLRHPPLYTDSFLLFTKAIMLFGRVTDHNVRGNLRNPTAPTKSQNPFLIPGFSELDKLVGSDFLLNLPQIYRHYGVSDAPDGASLDADLVLYMVHIIPHAATITLHNPYIDFTDRDCVSTARCVHAARSILSAYYKLSATSLDITRLHPFATICWYLAAVVEVQLCKYFIEIGDPDRESTVWGEINVLRFAMLEYGRRSPIGTRQESLLQGLMREIVRMTTQKQPLEVGFPLYAFSHATAFAKDAVSQSTTNEPLPAPLPVSMLDPSFGPGPMDQGMGMANALALSNPPMISSSMWTMGMDPHV
ncbi:hypothetical protein BD626DRAFT_486984 [Schizophyllum amplum]|uniref:Zn(2)-C6 fungal-type domain-containing protein n=1 Tax=Schizophyllum amplum TaxID=97359 RepID=A0A550CN07_9AGAR|nr:hypothetical protein BD626DRAFT_486984 [Auriculariopsis ampla]